MEFLKKELELLNQGQVLKFYEELSDEKKLQLKHEIEEVDWKNLSSIYQEQVLPQTEGKNTLKPTLKIDDSLLAPLPSRCIEGTTRCDQETLDKYKTTGLTEISRGKVAALLLAGGQGTRLGVDYPKGMYDVGLPTHKSLFQLQAERILRREESSELETGRKANIIWYVMTSEATMDMTREYFEKHNYFGLSQDNVAFFEQGSLPCFSFDGKVLLSDKHKLSRSPDGNGGLFEALHKKGIIDDMTNRGVEYIHVYCVDNILVRVCDPTFMGYGIAKGVDTAAKVVEKVLPNEAVGTICKVGDKFKVIEYSEISDEVAQRRDDATGKLAFSAGNICEHFFKLTFLQSIKDEKVLPYHIAIKKIPYVDMKSGERVKPDQPNGIKLEKFIFDVFEYTDKFAAWEVNREDEFSPVKNAIGTEKDNPVTALKALQRAYDLGLLVC